MEVHTDIYEVSDREQELQELHDVEVDKIPYHVTYHATQNPIRNAKISANNKGKVVSQEHRDGISAKLTGREFSSETIQKMRAAQLGKVKSKETRANMSNPKSEETKAKMSAARKGIPHPKVQCPHCERTISTTNIKRHIIKHEKLQGIHTNTTTTNSN